MKSFLSTVALLVLAGNLAICQTSTIDNRRITLSFTEDTDLTQDDIEYLTNRMENSIGNVEDISVDGQTVTLTFTDVVNEIGEEAFSNLTITSITIPSSVTIIGDGAFTGCSSLRNISSKFASADGRCLITNGKLIAFAGDGLSNYTIPSSVTEIGYGAFSDCSSLASIIIPNSVTEIGDYAFSGCSSLTSISIPNAVTKIGGRAFVLCSSLTSVTIPNSVTEIGGGAFMGCKSLTSVTIPSSVTEIGDKAFEGCPLESVTVPCNAKIAEDSFDETTSVIYQ